MTGTLSAFPVSLVPPRPLLQQTREGKLTAYLIINTARTDFSPDSTTSIVTSVIEGVATLAPGYSFVHTAVRETSL